MIAVTSYAVCFLGFLFLSLIVAVSRGGGGHRLLLLAGSTLTALWSASMVAAEVAGLTPALCLMLETARNGIWLALPAALLGLFTARHRLAVATAAAGLIVMAGLEFFLPILPGATDAAQSETQVIFGPILALGHVLVPVAALLMMENLYRNSGRSIRWGVKYLCFGLGAIYAYDFFFYSDALLLQHVDARFAAARGFVTVLAVPMLALAFGRRKSWPKPFALGLQMSRTVIFHSMALTGSGIYLLLMSAVGFYIKQYGKEWGETLQIAFMFAVLLMMAVIFSSGMATSKIRVLIHKHFFRLKYDYREEWLRFTQTLSSRDGGLAERVIRALADIVDSPAGALWVRGQEDEVFEPGAKWNYHGDRRNEPADGKLVRFLESSGWIIDLDEYRTDPGRYQGLELPEWLTGHSRAWLVLPMIHRETVFAFVVLDHARARRRLDWEDHDLLKTSARHAASYLAEELAMTRLTDSQRLEAFNRRFAFVVHDIKNVVGQMSLMLKNAEKFGDNPEFQQDMLLTVRNSVERMTNLLEQLSAQRRQDMNGPSGLLLTPVLRKAVGKWRSSKPDLILHLPQDENAAAQVMVAGDEGTLMSVFDHLLHNAIEAAGEDGMVAMDMSLKGGRAVISVEDNGPGMDQDFIQTQLFRPLDSTKSSGYGLGAYQTRHLVREMGGRLEVESNPGKGTAMRVVLPVQGSQPRPAFAASSESVVP